MSEHLRDQLQTTLGDAYALQRELGGGGMSRVFLARDAALGREIVVKVLPHDTAAGVSAERFKREIQTAARLQHPHIVPLLSAGETGGLPFYTMPFVKGESLRVRLSRSGELSVNEAIHVLRDIAAALAYAHSEGVVHRDIKPDNVILSGGVAVVTDFGVSKAVDVASTEDGTSQGGLTSLGVALGTPAYMSPEQASADPHVDHRADIYSFGCVAYELLTGTSPFAGRPPQQMLAAHVKDVPEPVLRRRPTAPPLLASLVMKCLEKRAGDRPQSAEELLITLDSIGTPSGGMAPTGERMTAVGKRRVWIGVLAAAVVVAGIVAAALVWRGGGAGSSYTLGASTAVAISSAIEGQPALSPDGKLVAYVVGTPEGDRVYVRQVDGGRANLLSSDVSGTHAWPQWSPDQQRISFAANGGIFVVPAMGGSPQRVIDGGPTHSWTRDGSIVFETSSGIWVQSLRDGTRRQLVASNQAHSPAVSPTGSMVAYVTGQPLAMANVSTGLIWVAPAAGGAPRRISDTTSVNASPVWTPDGESLLYISSAAGNRDVYQQPLQRNGAPRGAPHRVTTAMSALTISLSADGSRIAYDVVDNHTNVWTVDIPRQGAASMAAARQLTRENQRIEILSITQDGKWLAYDSDRSGNFDIYKVRLEGSGDPIQLTSHPGNDFAPAWSPSGTEIAFHAHRSGSRDIYVVSADGRGEKQVTSGPEEDFIPYWSPDGQKLVYFSVTPQRWAPLTVSRDGQGNWSVPTPLAPQGERVANARWSPNGVDLAYVRADSMRLTQLRISGGEVGMLSSLGGTPRLLAGADALKGSAQKLAWGKSPDVVFVSVEDSRGALSIWAVPVAGGKPRLVLAEDGTRRFGRAEFDTDGSRLYFTLASWESDVKVVELKR